MAHLHKKLKRGRPYYYIREIARVDGKPKVVNQVYIGTAERILDMAREDKDRRRIRRLQIREFGSLFVANFVENKTGVCEIINEVLPRKKGAKGPTIGWQ